MTDATMDIFMMWTGYAFWSLVLLAVSLFLLLLLWTHLSISISFFWIRIKADERYPKAKGIKADFKQKRFWKAKLLWMLVTSLKNTAQMSGSTISGFGYSADYTGWIPKLKLINLLDYSDDEPEVDEAGGGDD